MKMIILLLLSLLFAANSHAAWSYWNEITCYVDGDTIHCFGDGDPSSASDSYKSSDGYEYRMVTNLLSDDYEYRSDGYESSDGYTEDEPIPSALANTTADFANEYVVPVIGTIGNSKVNDYWLEFGKIEYEHGYYFAALKSLDISTMHDGKNLSVHYDIAKKICDELSLHYSEYEDKIDYAYKILEKIRKRRDSNGDNPERGRCLRSGKWSPLDRAGGSHDGHRLHGSCPEDIEHTVRPKIDIDGSPDH